MMVDQAEADLNDSNSLLQAEIHRPLCPCGAFEGRDFPKCKQ